MKNFTLHVNNYYVISIIKMIILGIKGNSMHPLLPAVCNLATLTPYLVQLVSHSHLPYIMVVLSCSGLSLQPL